jgi:hypothetical protein
MAPRIVCVGRLSDAVTHMRRLALSLGMDHVVVILSAPEEGQSAVDMIPISMLPALCDDIEKMVNETNSIVALTVYPNAQFTSVEEQASALDAMQKAGTS